MDADLAIQVDQFMAEDHTQAEAQSFADAVVYRTLGGRVSLPFPVGFSFPAWTPDALDVLLSEYDLDLDPFSDEDTEGEDDWIDRLV